MSSGMQEPKRPLNYGLQEIKCHLFLWGMFAGHFTPTIYVSSLLESKRSKRWGQKNIQNKAIQTKINLYNNKYLKKKITKHYEYSNIAC